MLIEKVYDGPSTCNYNTLERYFVVLVGEILILLLRGRVSLNMDSSVEKGLILQYFIVQAKFGPRECVSIHNIRCQK